MNLAVDHYLDQVCARLRLSPIEADQVREELRCHLEELIESYSAGGVDRREATDLALAWFGDAHRIHDCLDVVHEGDAWWLARLKGLALGACIGIVLGLLIPFGGHIEFLLRHFPILGTLAGERTSVLINALIVGSLIGLFSSGGRSLFVGWTLGSLVWLAEYTIFWIHGVATNATVADQSFSMLSSVLLSPLLGGLFGATVGIGTAVGLSRLSKARPEIR